MPVPVVPKPALAELVQPYVVPETGLLKLIAAAEILPQKVAFETALTVGVGLTVTVKLRTGPGQVPFVGVTLTVAVTGVAPALVAVNAAILPVPEVPKPTFAELVQP